MMPGAKPVRVLIVEDDTTMRDEVRRVLLASGFDVTDAVGTVHEGTLLLGQADVVLVDLGLPDGHGNAVLAAAHTLGIPSLVLSALADDDAIFGALRAGALGYCLKVDGISGIHEALKLLLEGGAPISPRIARRVIESFRPTTRTPVDDLTPRELEVLQYFVHGCTYVEVGRVLGVSVNTVRTFVRGIYDKLHVASKAEAVARYLARSS